MLGTAKANTFAPNFTAFNVSAGVSAFVLTWNVLNSSAQSMIRPKLPLTVASTVRDIAKVNLTCRTV